MFDVLVLSVRIAINSVQSQYVKSVIKQKIGSASIVLCLIGNGTAWRDWVDWELQAGLDMGKGFVEFASKVREDAVPRYWKPLVRPSCNGTRSKLFEQLNVRLPGEAKLATRPLFFASQ